MTLADAVADAAVINGDTLEIQNASADWVAFQTTKSLYVRGAVGVTPTIRGRTEMAGGTFQGVKIKGKYATAGPTILDARVSSGGTLVVQDCTIEADTLLNDTKGVLCKDGTVIIRNTTLDKATEVVSPFSVNTNATVTFEDCRILTGGGIIMDNQAVSLRRSTLVKAYTVTSPPTTSAFLGGSIAKVIQVIVQDFSTVFGTNCPSDSVYYNIFDGYSTLGCTINGTNNLLATDPLFCEGREGLVNLYSLRIDSPAIATNNAWGRTVGKTDGVQCAWGSLARNATVAANSSIIVLEDVIVGSGKNLTLNSGVTFSFDDDDNSGQGTDNGENEITVTGRLTATGTNASKVTFRSSAGSPAANDWFGINGTGDVHLDYVKVQHSQYGVHPAGTDTIVIDRSVFSDNGTYDIYIGSAPKLTISRSVFTVKNIGINLICSDFSNCKVFLNKLTAVNSSSVAGIKIDGAGSPTGGVVATKDTVTNFSGGAGIHVMDSTPTFINCRTTDNKYGFHIQGGFPLIGTPSDTSDNAIVDNTRGIYVQGTGPSTCYDDTVIEPVVRNNLIDDNTYGVVTEKTTYVDLGYDASHKGLNSFLNIGTYCIWNRANSSCGTVLSYGDYFGGGAPSCGDGLVSFQGWETTQPASFRRGIGVEPSAPIEGLALRLTGVRPNPIQASTVVSFAVGTPANSVRLDVFDVTGRLVRNLLTGSYATGSYEVPWDGTNAFGTSVPEGMYFVRLSDGNVVRHTAKLMVLR